MDSFNPIGSGLTYDPSNPTAPVMKNFDPACTLYPEIDLKNNSVGSGLWGPGGSDSAGGSGGSGDFGVVGADVS